MEYSYIPSGWVKIYKSRHERGYFCIPVSVFRHGKLPVCGFLWTCLGVENSTTSKCSISARHFATHKTQSVLFWALFTLFAPNKYSTLWIIPQSKTACTRKEENSPEPLRENGRQQSVSKAGGWKAGHLIHITEHTQALTLGSSS